MNTFYKDTSNEEALVMIGLIAESDTELFPNPVIIYGDSLNGKSHLVEILKERVKERGKKIKVINSDTLISELVDRMKESEGIRQFCEGFNEYDVIVVEDLQFLEGKASSQQILIDIAQRFIHEQKKILFTMNVHPSNLIEFNSKLQAIFVNSVQIPILSPTEKLKKQMIKDWCRNHKQKISKKIVKKISQKSNSVGEVISILTQLDIYITYYGLKLDNKLVKRTLKVRGKID